MRRDEAVTTSSITEFDETITKTAAVSPALQMPQSHAMTGKFEQRSLADLVQMSCLTQ